MSAQKLVVALAAVLACAQGLGLTVPGTKWCGPGNIADNYNDLGTEVQLDMCCRGHDHCEETIPAKEERYGLINERLYPIFSCACESAFRQCLSSLHNIDSAILGRVYFSSRNVCFGFGPPILSCQEQQWDLFMKRCVKYNENTSQPGRWQFYDQAFYTHPSSEEEQQEQQQQLD